MRKAGSDGMVWAYDWLIMRNKRTGSMRAGGNGERFLSMMKRMAKCMAK